MASPCSQPAKSKTETVPTLTTANILKACALRSVDELDTLRYCLDVSGDSWEKIQQLDSAEEQLKAVIDEWLSTTQQPLWRDLIVSLDQAGETSAADRIKDYAEPLADPTLTEENISTVMKVVGDWRTVGSRLIGSARCDIIQQAYSSDEERASAAWCYYINTSPWASWQHLACELYRAEEAKAVEAVKQFLPEKDPSVTTENVIEALSGLEEEWDTMGDYLDIPDSKSAEIQRLYESKEEKLRAAITHWVHTHPRPSWDDVVYALQRLSTEKAAESIREKYIKATEKSKRLFQKAMKNGFIRATDHTVLFIGFAGNGKTCSMCLMQNKPPPPERTSTPCAKTPVRSIASSRAEKHETEEHETEWHPVQRSDLTQMVAESSVAFQQDKSEVEQKQENMATQASHEQTLASTPHSTQHSPIAQKSRSKVSRKDFREKFALKMDECKFAKPRKEVHWIDLIDSGGQPQFQEALPTFINEAAACFLVVKLCDCLDDHPMVEMYREDKLLSRYRSPLSHRQTLQYCIRTVQSQTSRGKEPPLIAFIGTHKDLEHLCTAESRADKNKKLEEMLPSDKSNYLFIGKELIAGFNAKTPGADDKELAGKVRKWVMECSHAKAIDIPLQYYGLEEALHDMVEENERGVFSKDECRAVGETLYFNDDSFEAALDYLARLKVILYYKSVLPDVVFCISQVLLDKVSELVSFFCYECSTADVTDGIEKKFREQALVTLELLKKERFSSHYIKGLFGPEQLIQLLENDELLLLAKVSDKEYLLPCALPTVERSKLFQCPSSSVPPLLVFFPHGGPRLGVFCRLVAYLLKLAKWKLLMRNKIPVEVTRNSVAFSLPGSFPGRVTLRDPLSSFFMVFVSTKFAKKIPEICPRVRATILEGIQHVSAILKYTNSSPEDAFLCSGEGSDCKSSPHPAIVVPDCDRELLTCTVDTEEGRTTTEEELVWFPKATASSTSAKCNPNMMELTCFQGKKQKINIAEEIGIQFNVVGTALLNDGSGTIIPAIIKKCLGDPLEINMEILRRWVQGGGIEDRSWQGLIGVLSDSKLHALADTIEEVKGQ